MTTPTQPKTPWYKCCLSATVEPEPQPAKQLESATKQPERRNSYQDHHFAGKFHHLHIDARIAANKAAHGIATADIDATDGKSLKTSRRHRKLDSNEVVDLKGALMRASLTAQGKPNG